MKLLYHLSRFLFGITFIFSGFVKGIDPWGSAYKFNDYFQAMGLGWLSWAGFALGVILAFTEFAIGVAILFHIRVKFFAWLGLLFMVFFTGLTFWIAIANPVTDCGCFGDALVISNWETFYKNLVLIALVLVIFKYRKTGKPLTNPKISVGFGAIFVLVYVIATIYSYNHLPIFDFRPYKVGTNIPEGMSYPEDATQDEYKNIFLYKNKNTGKVKEFTEENYPWQDTANWEYYDSESTLVKKGYEPPIHDFTFQTREGEDVVDFFIHDENYVFVLVSHDLNKASTKNMDKVNKLANWANESGYTFVGLTASLFEDSDIFLDANGADFEFFNCDEITLKTIIRSNPGLIVIRNGIIEGKWHYNDIPNTDEFSEEFK